MVNGIIYIDHKGNKYSSVSEMCKAYNIAHQTYRSRLERGMSVKEALTTPLHESSVWGNKCVDHLGNEFPSISEMCKSYNIRPQTYRSRLKKGMSVKEALTTPLHESSAQANKCVDHLDNEFPSISEMCKSYNIRPQTYRDRLKRGMSVKEALTTPLHKSSVWENKCIDHLGNEFPSKRKMCAHWRIRPATYSRRIKSGWSKEKALTTHKARPEKKEDHIGEVYLSNCGLTMTIIGISEPKIYTQKKESKEYKNVYNRYIIQFEDGIIISNVYYDKIQSGSIKHPTLTKKIKVGKLGGIQTKFISGNKENVFYECECPICGWKSIETPSKIIEHSKRHQKEE